MLSETLEIPKRTSGRSGISRPTSKWLYRLRALHRAYLRSTVHIALQEICSLPRYIGNIREMNPSDMSPDALILPSELRQNQSAWPIVDACIEGIQRAHVQLGAGRLSLRLYARGFDEGARWMLDSVRKETERRLEGPKGSL